MKSNKYKIGNRYIIKGFSAIAVKKSNNLMGFKFSSNVIVPFGKSNDNLYYFLNDGSFPLDRKYIRKEKLNNILDKL
jgi:hypothetical protein